MNTTEVMNYFNTTFYTYSDEFNQENIFTFLIGLFFLNFMFVYINIILKFIFLVIRYVLITILELLMIFIEFLLDFLQ